MRSAARSPSSGRGSAGRLGRAFQRGGQRNLARAHDADLSGLRLAQPGAAGAVGLHLFDPHGPPARRRAHVSAHTRRPRPRHARAGAVIGGSHHDRENADIFGTAIAGYQNHAFPVFLMSSVGSYETGSLDLVISTLILTCMARASSAEITSKKDQTWDCSGR